ncbi:hypothetical protein ABZT47_15480 [Sphaerisporangium sp. NPDC005289]|uniref:hypothetical protein n=1 Tax=Sphaerisporangium sp. NPDC005289 TaxID=3155247 RepID=UPI0033A406E4
MQLVTVEFAGVERAAAVQAYIYEVVAALETLGFSERQIQEAASRKRAERGGFSRRLWLDKVTSTG